MVTDFKNDRKMFLMLFYFNRLSKYTIAITKKEGKALTKFISINLKLLHFMYPCCIIIKY